MIIMNNNYYQNVLSLIVCHTASVCILFVGANAQNDNGLRQLFDGINILGNLLTPSADKTYSTSKRSVSHQSSPNFFAAGNRLGSAYGPRHFSTGTTLNNLFGGRPSTGGGVSNLNNLFNANGLGRSLIDLISTQNRQAQQKAVAKNLRVIKPEIVEKSKPVEILQILNPVNQGELQSKIIDSTGINFPKLKQLGVVGENFGIKKGKGCVPFLSEVVRLLWADCQTKADSLTWNTWGNQIQNALKGGQLDVVGAMKESCRLQADRQSCQTMSSRIQNCDILGTIQATVDINNAKKRCNQITAFTVPNQAQNGGVFGNIGQLVTNELAGGFIRHFFGNL